MLSINEVTGHLSFASRVRQTMRKCTYCYSTQHKITECNDERLVQFHNKLIRKKHDLRGFDKEDCIIFFNIWLNEFSAGLVKAYSIRYCATNTRETLPECIRIITEKIFSEEEEEAAQRQEEEEYIPLLQGNTPTPAPPFQLFTDEEVSFFLEPEMIELFYALRGRSPSDIRTSVDRKYDIQTTLITCSQESKQEREEQRKLESQECDICYEEYSVNQFVKYNCMHEFCGQCVQTVLRSCCPYRQPSCAICRTTISSLELREKGNVELLKDNLCEIRQMIAK